MNVETHEDIRRILITEDLGRIADSAAALALNAHRIRLKPDRDLRIAVGSSKLGGAADVPEDFVWPVWKELPLNFVGQIDLAEVRQPNALPPDGTLSFFYVPDHYVWGFDPNDRGAARVFYFEDSSRLVRRPYPSPKERGILGAIRRQLRRKALEQFNPCRAEIVPCPSVPSSNSDVVRSWELSDAEWERYHSFFHELWKGPSHQLLGCPHAVQNDMELECQLVTNGINCGKSTAFGHPRSKELADGAKDWILLLQLDSDENDLGVCWGDCGMIYYWIRRQDLESRAFDKAWLILQCC